MNQIRIKQEPLTKIYPTACGLTADNRPNISFIPIPEFNNGMPFSLWYYTTFYKKDDALDFLKEVFKDGVSLEDVGIDSKFALWLRMDELREIS